MLKLVVLTLVGDGVPYVVRFFIFVLIVLDVSL
jgi:hypothetical protein